jgi:iron only hydrogenase large subunit-like protein
MKNNPSEGIQTLTIISELCTGCMKCVRGCPVEAMRFRDGLPFVKWGKCIHCGECIKACDAIQPLTTSFLELSRFKYTIAIPSPAFVGQFEKHITPSHTFFALKSFGFDDVVNLAPFCSAYFKAVKFIVAEADIPKPVISSMCPVVVSLIQTKYPSLIEHLLPIMPPRQLAAKQVIDSLVKDGVYKKEEIGVIYITPCISKMIEVKEFSEESYIHGAIAIKHIYNEILKKIKPSEKMDIGNSLYGFRQAVAGGLTDIIGEENVLVVSGIKNLKKVFDDIEMGKVRKISFVDTYACSEGCIGGTLTVDDVYIARQKILSLFSKREPDEEEEKLVEIYLKNRFNPVKRWGTKKREKSLSLGVKLVTMKDELLKNLPKIDCGLCGAPTCEAFAEDVIEGEADERDCIFDMIKHKEIKAEEFLLRWKKRGGKDEAE